MILYEIIIIALLSLLNGFFSMSEIALISVRKTRIAELAKSGNSRAKVIQQLHNNPEKLFATIQVGISIITIVASAFAGASIAEQLSVILGKSHLSFIANHAYAISFILIVALVAYLNLILGELVPKSLGLRYAERLSLLAAYPIWGLSKISAWPIRFLTLSSNFILKPFKDSTNFTESRISEQEIRALLDEGRRAGTIEAHEHNIIENVFEFADLSVGKIMVPRTKIVAFDIRVPGRDIVRQSIESGYSRIPIFQDNLNHVVGILYTKRLLAHLEKNLEQINLEDFLVPAYFVPSVMKISEVLHRLQKRKAHMAMVTDEHGEIEGLVTLEDILEEIVGEISDETDEVSKSIKADGENFIVEGEVSILDFNKFFGSDLPEDEEYATVSGFILHHLKRFPKPGDVVTYKDMEFMVKDATLRVVKTLSVKRKI